jgi:Alpha/beta hydrolase domain
MSQLYSSCRHVLLLMPILFLSAFPTNIHAGASIPTVTVAPAGTHGFPYLSSALDLSGRGYVEKEFLITGTAQAYVNDGPFLPNGIWNAVPNPGVTAPYTVRLLVRRPVEPARFNGTVLVEWLNVSGNHDISPDWTWAHEELLREGYAYVGVTAQFLGARALQNWESGPADRYASIFHPGDSFAHDIFSQAGQAIAHPKAGGPKPLGELTPRIKALLADGESQSAGYLFTYVNSVHRLASVYDGFLIHSIGFALALSDDVAAFDFDGTPIPPPPGVPATPFIFPPFPGEPIEPAIRTDLGTSVLFVNTEADVTDFILGGRSIHQQPNSQSFRLWEIAGASHFDRYQFDHLRPDLAKSDTLDLPSASEVCEGPPINAGPQTYVMRAAVHALNLWVRHGVPAPIAPRISLQAPPFPDFVTIDRSPLTGLAIGGIRLPQVAVPVATLTGDRPLGALSPNSCFILFGTLDRWNGDSDAWDGQAEIDPSPTPEPDLRIRYRSHQDYVARVAAAAARSTLHGFLRPRDAVLIVKEAQASTMP